MFQWNEKKQLDHNIELQMELEELWSKIEGRPIMRGMVYKDPLSRFAIVAVPLGDYAKGVIHNEFGADYTLPKSGCILYTTWTNEFNKRSCAGSSPNSEDFENEAAEEKFFSICNMSWWSPFHSDDFPAEVIAQMIGTMKAENTFKKKRLMYIDHSRIIRVVNAYENQKTVRKYVSNKNLCKIDGLNLKGNVDYVYGILSTGSVFEGFDENNDIIHSNQFLLSGYISDRAYGCITGIFGVINEGLIGDLTGITGDVTNIYGDCTGITIHIGRRIPIKTHIKSLLLNVIPFDQKLLSNEESQQAWNAYRRLAHCTLGLSDEERALIDQPVKAKPPFKLDKWGRFYYNENGHVWVYSVNPSDIAFLKEIGKLNTCFCFTSYGHNGRWCSGMRALMALNCCNPNLGCIFKLAKDGVKKMNMFKDLKFKWFNVTEGTLFQYDKDGNVFWGYDHIPDPANVFGKERLKDVPPIHGHDSKNCGHNRQYENGYLEVHINDNDSWRGGLKPAPNIIGNQRWAVILDKNFNEIEREIDESYYGPKPNVDKYLPIFIEEAKIVKEILNGIEV